MKLRTWIALGLLVVGIAGCSADQELRELKNEDGWMFGTIIPFVENELVILDHPAQPSRIAILECESRWQCEVLAVDPLTGGAPRRALFYPVADGLVFSVSNLVYHYRPQQDTLTHFELTEGSGGVLYLIDGIVHFESQHGVIEYDLATGAYLGHTLFQNKGPHLPPVFSSEEEIDNYVISTYEITDETRSYYERLLNLTPVDDFGRPIEK